MKYRYDIRNGIQKVKTKTFIAVSAVGLILGGGGLSLALFGTAHALVPGCSPGTYYYARDNVTLQAMCVNPTSPVSGDVNATGYDIGVLYTNSYAGGGNITTAYIHGAKYFGVAVDNASVDVTGGSVYQIGDVPPSGAQHGVAIYYTNGASGNISGVNIYDYQKNGVAVTGAGTRVAINNNNVTGAQPTSAIAQNGIEFGYGAVGSASGNTIDGNWYTGANWTATGLLLFDVNANQVKDSQNMYRNNQTNHAVVTSQACPHMYGGLYETYGLCTYP